MKIISLVENISGRDDIACEHGLSLYIEACGKRILFDMGQSELFSDNAERLGIDLARVDFAILSHGHYDHGGGLKKFLKINNKADIYIRKNAFMPYFHGERYIGLDRELELNDRLIKTDGELLLSDGLTLVGLDVEPESSDGLTMELGGERMPDKFDHEQYLIIEEGDRRVLISGCSHKGILKIAKTFKPDVLVGGFHFMNMPLDEKLADTSKRLNDLGCSYYTCHCTGREQFDFIKKYISRIEYLSAGKRIEI